MNAMSQGSFTAAQNRRSGTLNASAIGSRTSSRENEQRPVEGEHQRAEVAEHAEPAPAHRHRDGGTDADRRELS